MPLTEAEKWLDHLGSCSPCFSDFSQFRKAYELRRRRALLAVAASIIIGAGIAGWVLLQKHNEALVAQTVVLDLRNRSVPRGTETNPNEQPLEVNRAATHLDIYLPLGSGEGPYDVRIVTHSGESLFATTGMAKLNKSVTSLQVVANLSSAQAGRYLLQIRKPELDWNSYSLVLR